jgi:hypothetical protein
VSEGVKQGSQWLGNGEVKEGQGKKQQKKRENNRKHCIVLF